MKILGGVLGVMVMSIVILVLILKRARSKGQFCSRDDSQDDEKIMTISLPQTRESPDRKVATNDTYEIADPPGFEQQSKDDRPQSTYATLFDPKQKSEPSAPNQIYNTLFSQAASEQTAHDRPSLEPDQDYEHLERQPNADTSTKTEYYSCLQHT